MSVASGRRRPAGGREGPRGTGPVAGPPGQARAGLRRAAAFACSTQARERPSARAVSADAVLAVAATAILLGMTASQASGAQPEPGLPGPARAHIAVTAMTLPGWQQILLATACAAPLAVRRLVPLTAFWVSLAAAVATPGYDTNALTLIVVILAAYSAMAYSRYHGAAMVCVPVAGLLVSAAFPGVSPRLPEGSTAILLVIPVVAAGHAMHTWRRQAGDSQARLSRLEAEHEAATQRALEQERARIAAELHDVVTHNVSVMIVQAGAARQVLGATPDDARAALLAVEASGRAAMTELRHLLGLLSPPAPAGAAGPGAGPAEDLRPQPGLRQLGPLIDRVSAAGLPVELDTAGLPAGLPHGLDLAAFRIVQEALTNVIKHAGRPRTRVTLGCHDGDLVVEVADDGPAMPGRAPVGAPGPGRGLLGLRERVDVYGGNLEAGPRPGGGWRVRARIPGTR